MKATRKAVSAGDADQVAQLQAELFGRTPPQTRTTTSRLQHHGALGPGAGNRTDTNPDGFYGKVHPGPIHRPQGGPIAAAFRAAPVTIERIATKAIDERMARRLADLGGSGPLSAILPDLVGSGSLSRLLGA